MLKLNFASEVSELALALGLRPKGDPAERIIRHCKEQVEDWIAEVGGVRDVRALEKLICRKKGLVIIEIWSDEDLEKNINHYVRKCREIGFAKLTDLNERDAFGCLMERHHMKRGDRDRYVAFVDCRGQKAQKRFFTRWHEIAHALTLVGQLELPVKRSGDHPIEKLMDAIAGEIAYHEPIVEPLLNAELDASGILTFDGMERIRQAGFPDASFQSTLIACARQAPVPLLLLEAELGYKNCELAHLDRGYVPKPLAKLRVVRAVPNGAARKAELFIPEHFQVPKESVIYTHYLETQWTETSIGVAGDENLEIWQSQGKRIGNLDIHVEVRRYCGVMLALIQSV